MTASIVIGMVGLGMTKAGALEFLSGSSSETVIVRITPEPVCCPPDHCLRQRGGRGAGP